MIGHPLFADLSMKRASFAGLRQRGNARQANSATDKVRLTLLNCMIIFVQNGRAISLPSSSCNVSCLCRFRGADLAKQYQILILCTSKSLTSQHFPPLGQMSKKTAKIQVRFFRLCRLLPPLRPPLLADNLAF